MEKNRLRLVAMVLCCCAGSVSFAAETVHLTLVGKDQGLIEGESTQLGLGREGTLRTMPVSDAEYAIIAGGEPLPKKTPPKKAKAPEKATKARSGRKKRQKSKKKRSKR